jgi:hypothetical protein
MFTSEQNWALRIKPLGKPPDAVIRLLLQTGQNSILFHRPFRTIYHSHLMELTLFARAIYKGKPSARVNPDGSAEATLSEVLV